MDNQEEEWERKSARRFLLMDVFGFAEKLLLRIPRFLARREEEEEWERIAGFMLPADIDESRRKALFGSASFNALKELEKTLLGMSERIADGK